MVLFVNQLWRFGGGGGCVWSWFTWLESGSLGSFPTSLGLLISPERWQAWPRAWCNYNLSWGFLLPGWEVGRCSGSMRSLGGIEGCCSNQRHIPPGRQVRLVSLTAWPCLAAPALPAPHHGPGMRLPGMAHLATVLVTSCGQPPLCGGTAAPCSTFSSLLAEVGKQETRFLPLAWLRELLGHQHYVQSSVQLPWKSQWSSLCQAKLPGRKGWISYGL